MGQVPEFRELDEAFEIVVTVDDTRRRDWFGLGIAIKAGEWHVAFADVLAALWLRGRPIYCWATASTLLQTARSS